MLGKLQFGLYELDRDALELRKEGVAVRLQEQPLRVLATLMERPGQIVTREELQERIWGKDTFVDFDYSLNKAVNRLREALNDEPGRPRYVETIPRRGYRFIAPVTAPRPVEQLPALPGSVAEPTPPPPPRVRITPIVILTVGVLAAMAIIALLWGRRPEKSTPAETRHITSAAVCCPTLSRDGKLLAYVSAASDGVMHIWVQQTAGGNALQVTSGSEGEIAPDFSPDGTHVAFVSGSGGIYIAPTLSGEPKLLPKTHGGYPYFSPSGEKILYWDETKAMTVSVDSGEPVSLSLNRDFFIHYRPLWSPNGDAIIFYGVSRRHPEKPDEFWIAPLTGGEPTSVRLPGAEQGDDEHHSLRAWVGSKGGGQWIIYSVSKGEVWKLFRIRVSSQGQVDTEPEQLTAGTGRLAYGMSVSGDGKLVYPISNFTESIYEIPTGSQGQKSGPTLQLPLAEGGIYRSPSLSRDGRWMVYDATIPGKSNMIVLRDLTSGVDHVMDEVGRSDIASDVGEATISPDGSKVIFERDCKNARFWDDGTPLPCSFIMAAAGREPEQICESCTPRGFSSNGSVVLIQNYNRDGKWPHTIAAVDLTSRTEKNFLSASSGSVYHAFFSWDDHWVVFKKEWNPEYNKPQIMIAPVRDGAPGSEAEWIPVTDGQHNDDKPQFAPDGNTVYFVSTRDGYSCIWAQRLDPATKRPVGGPLAYEHFHTSAQRDTGHFSSALHESDLSVARDKILINLVQDRADIWMTQVP